MIWIILIGVYLISAILSYRHLHIAHSKGGRWESIDTSNIDVFVTVFPVVNTVMMITSWLFVNPYEMNNNRNKFFNIKK